MLNPSLPLTNFTKEEGEALTMDLTNLGIVLEEEGIWIKGEKKEGEMWSDQEHHKKRLTSIQVAISDFNNDIIRLRVAYNGEWCEWRETADSFGNPVEQPPLHIKEEDAVLGVKTLHNGVGGGLVSLHLTLRSGQQHSWGSTITEGSTKMMMASKQPLAYLSGGKTRVGHNSRYQLTFHWENSGSCF